ncbi:MAG: nitroreductase family protein [Acidimicrobiia bacterium]|nr:MAG: nitroreductase family protein [Acidimicrobiia bacterium]
MSYPTVPYEPLQVPEHDQRAVGLAVFAEMDRRRTVREFSDRPVPRELVETAIRCASTAPSGAHMQPWTFVLIGDPDLKRQIRIAAETEERENYEGGRLPPHWREDLAPLGTDWHKPFLETVPWIVVVFEQRYGIRSDGSKQHHYYVKESVGIACGMFIDALHRMGLSTLTHTPSPMAFLSTMLGRPKNERPFILFPIGYAAEGCEIPALKRKGLDEVMVEATASDRRSQSTRRGPES